MIDQAIISRAVELLREAAPGATIILFGSHARADADKDSDLDFLVIEPEVANRFAETLRLSDVLRPLHVPIDVVVTSQDDFDYWAETPGTLYYEAVVEGKVFEAVPRTG